LEKGRRQQPLEEHQVAEAVERQSVRLSQSVLAQRLSSLADGNAVRDFVAARRGVIDPRLLVGGLRGAVGYMPVIQQLPEGMSMTANAVVSADRRYVRITPTPFFSDIREVVRFNFVSGGQQTDSGGTGGFGGGAGGFGGGGFGGGGGF